MIKVTIRKNDNYADVEFPCSDNYLYSRLVEIHADYPNIAMAFVSDVIEPNELNCLKDHYANLDELNFLAKRMDSFFGNEETQFFEALKLEHFTELKDLVNLTFNLNKYTLITDVSNMGKVGREYLLNKEGHIPADDEDNPKYAEIGRQLLNSGRGVFTDYGLLIPDHSMPFEEVYNGKTFPAYLYDRCLLVGEIKYEDKSEFIYLPTDELAISKALNRLGAEKIDDCNIELSNVNKNEDIYDLFQSVFENEGIYELNNITVALKNNAQESNLEKLSAVMKLTDISEAKSIVTLIENLNAFEYLSDVNDNEELANWWIDNDPNLFLSIDLEEYFDYEAYGENLVSDLTGEFLDDGGYVFLQLGYYLEDIFDTDEEETMTMGGM